MMDVGKLDNNIDIETGKSLNPKIIVLSYVVVPAYGDGYYKKRAAQLELFYSDEYEIVKDDYAQSMNGDESQICHHLIAKRIDDIDDEIVITDIADKKVVRRHVVKVTG